MTPPKEPLGHLELSVLQYVADHPSITVREVAAHFAETSGLARTTLLTVMERLRSKAYLKRKKAAARINTRPRSPRPSCCSNSSAISSMRCSTARSRPSSLTSRARPI